MIPFFPNLKPSLSNRFWCDVPSEDEVQTKRYEDERKNWVYLTYSFGNSQDLRIIIYLSQRESLKNAASDLQPLGKVLTLPGIETDDEDGTRHWTYSIYQDFNILFLKANDDSEDTDSHDEEDDETNDRVIPVTQDFYSADDIQMNDETSPTAP